MLIITIEEEFKGRVRMASQMLRAMFKLLIAGNVSLVFKNRVKVIYVKEFYPQLVAMEEELKSGS